MDNVLRVGSVVACCNLQCRSSVGARLPCLVGSEVSTFTVRTAPHHLNHAMIVLQAKLKVCYQLDTSCRLGYCILYTMLVRQFEV